MEARLWEAHFEGAIEGDIKFSDCELDNITFKSSKMSNIDKGKLKY